MIQPIAQAVADKDTTRPSLAGMVSAGARVANVSGCTTGRCPFLVCANETQQHTDSKLMMNVFLFMPVFSTKLLHKQRKCSPAKTKFVKRRCVFHKDYFSIYLFLSSGGNFSMA